MNRRNRITAAIALGALLAAGAAPARAAKKKLDPDVERILKSMSTYLTSAKAFRMKADVALEVILRTGQKLQLCSSYSLLFRRPSEFRITVKGTVADAEFLFDGKTLTLYGKKPNAYVQRPVAGNIDDAIHAWEGETGIAATGADLLLTNVYSILTRGVRSSDYFGTGWVNGVECHHLSLRKKNVDLQLWVATGDRPLPMKYVITTKWMTGAPQFELVLRDWDTSPGIKDGQFTFTAPAGAKKLDAVPLQEIDEFPGSKEGE
jgi:hypothetical protein